MGAGVRDGERAVQGWDNTVNHLVMTLDGSLTQTGKRGYLSDSDRLVT
jgi:hypothetical protein